jgi:hypothetical protein
MTRIRLLCWLDILLLVIFVVLQTPRATGIISHEWIGILLGPVIALHLLVNWHWIKNTLRCLMAPRSWRARINGLLNATLFVVMVLTVFSGLTISEVLLPLIGLQPSDLSAWRQLHSLLSNLGLVIVGFHLALNWDWIIGVVRTRLRVHHLKDPASIAALDVNRLAYLGAQTDGPTHGTTSIPSMKALGLQDWRATFRRLMVIGLVVVVLSASCFALVESLASQTIRRGTVLSMEGPPDHGASGKTVGVEPRLSNREQHVWAVPDLADLPQEAGIALLIVGIAAVVGRILLRFRLQSRPPRQPQRDHKLA